MLSESHYTEEKLTLKTFKTSEALKEEIDIRIRRRQLSDWDVVKIFSKGPYLFLTFKQKAHPAA